ncbi:hypothetical protein AAKU64_003357 [Undibacterium sp. GrIS 1.8]|uniref:hypothetical protein n=1 Tax=Undibacterium sp. GrIS 1.8 TaxID=3143934 RepID=UPI003390CD2F
MKHKQLSILAASLVAAFAANVASAGQIQSTSSAIAHETIVNDAQAVSAPPVSYRFAGDIDATLVTQSFQIQLVLKQGTFKTAGSANAITLVDNTGNIIPVAKYTVSTPTLSADKTVLFANVTFPQLAGTTYVTPAVRFNDTVTNANAGAVAATVSNLYTLVGAVLPCVNSVPTLGVSVKEFANVTSTAQATDALNANPANEHTRAGSTNDGTLFTFPTNLSVSLVAATTNLAKVDAANQNTLFKATSGVATATSGFQTTTVANLGTVTIKQDSTGSDSGSNNPYLLTAATYPATAATNTTGAVELKNFNVKVVSSQGFAIGSTVWLSTTANGPAVGGATATVTATTGNTVTLTSTSLTPAQLAAPLFVVYTVPGTAVIPVSTFNATGTLSKAPDSGTTYLNEQDNSCTKPLASLVGGVKVDVRNYATPTTGGGWTSVIRLINPSEVNTATVYGQLIHADGSYGNWGALGTLAPRAVSNLTSTAINALLTTVPTSVTPGAAGPVANTNGAGDRLRISADGVSALKVQNYLYNPDSKNFIEASSAQGVDFDSSTDRVPSDAQANDQDAQTGLVK